MKSSLKIYLLTLVALFIIIPSSGTEESSQDKMTPGFLTNKKLSRQEYEINKLQMNSENTTSVQDSGKHNQK